MQPSRWLKARTRAPPSTRTPGPKTTWGSTTASRPITVSRAKNTVEGAVSVTPSSSMWSLAASWNAASAAARSARELTPIVSASSQVTTSDRSPRSLATATTSVR